MTIRTGIAAAAACASLGVLAGAVAQDSFGGPPPQQQQEQQQQYPQQGYPQQQPQQYPQPQQSYPQQQPQGYPQQQQPQQYPPQQGNPQPQPQQQQQQYPQQQQGNPQQGGLNLDALAQMERQDYGVPPTAQLHAGQMHGPTPASIPGGQVITTKGLVELVRGGQVQALILDVLGGPELLPGAQYAVPAHQAGSFNDQTQQAFGQFLQQATGGRKDHPIVLYCLSTQCWMSYNAALRAINMGYTNVLWYRGGVEAWKQAGQPVVQANAGYQQ